MIDLLQEPKSFRDELHESFGIRNPSPLQGSSYFVTLGNCRVSTEFNGQAFRDPIYRQILGIGSDDTLDNWYDLLGVRQFESSVRVLDRAMLKRFQQVRQYQVGTYETEALELIDELSQAYACLTNQEQRQQYEDSLRQEPLEPAAGSVEAAVALPPARSREPEQETTHSDPNLCANCGKKTAPKAPACYHCGHKKVTVLARRAKSSGRSPTSDDASLRDLVKQDLSPEQLLRRLQETRLLIDARKKAAGAWKEPKNLTKSSSREAGSRCSRCRKGLMTSTDAYGIRRCELSQTKEYIQNYARKLESLGRGQFTWPLAREELRRVQQSIPNKGSKQVLLYCRGCTLRILHSSRIGSEP